MNRFGRPTREATPVPEAARWHCTDLLCPQWLEPVGNPARCMTCGGPMRETPESLRRRALDESARLKQEGLVGGDHAR
jgi:hypothetical protein